MASPPVSNCLTTNFSIKVDTLKMRAYGVKNPIKDKATHIKEIDRSTDKRYYPQTKDGVFDEWAAVAQLKYETAT